MALRKVEICANCGSVAKEESSTFKCPRCGCVVSVVVSKEIFLHMVKEGLVKE